MKGVMKRLSNLGFSMELTTEAKDFIAEKGYDIQFGQGHCTGQFKNTWKIAGRRNTEYACKGRRTLLADLDEKKEKIIFTLKPQEKKAEAESESKV
jgi:ATP-dependent Clp protease ATP-binding subunit ClpC